MRLFHIDKPNCTHITEVMPGIKAVYQLEQEFNPYLVVEFLPNKIEKPGIILMTKDKIIRRDYTFDNPNDIEELRKLIWKYLLIDHGDRIQDVAGEDGCISNGFRKYPTNIVIQSWAEKKRMMKGNRCCKYAIDVVASELAPHLKSPDVRHERYRLDTRNMIDRDICKKIRYQECGDNYAPNTAQFDRCVDEVTWLCHRGYPDNKVDKARQTVQRIKNRIYKYLEMNKTLVDKQKLDKIFTVELFTKISDSLKKRERLTFEDTRKIVKHILKTSGDLERLKHLGDHETNLFYYAIGTVFLIFFICFLSSRK